MDIAKEFTDKHFDCTRCFSHLKEAYYGENILKHADFEDDITLGFYHADGGTTGEFSIKWVNIGSKVVPKLEAFDDSWNALLCFADVLQKMAENDNNNLTPQEFCELLKTCDITDITKREIG